MTKILIAEDEPDIRELITYTLKFGGFDVVVTNNGEEVVKAAPRVRPDLIVLDVRMPRMTGYEACRKLKDNPRTAKIPVIFLSAKGQEKEVLDGMESGAIDYILKPFDPAALLNKIGEVLSSDSKSRKGKKK